MQVCSFRFVPFYFIFLFVASSFSIKCAKNVGCLASTHSGTLLNRNSINECTRTLSEWAIEWKFNYARELWCIYELWLEFTEQEKKRSGQIIMDQIRERYKYTYIYWMTRVRYGETTIDRLLYTRRCLLLYWWHFTSSRYRSIVVFFFRCWSILVHKTPCCNYSHIYPTKCYAICCLWAMRNCPDHRASGMYIQCILLLRHSDSPFHIDSLRCCHVIITIYQCHRYN